VDDDRLAETVYVYWYGRSMTTMMGSSVTYPPIFLALMTTRLGIYIMVGLDLLLFLVMVPVDDHYYFYFLRKHLSYVCVFFLVVTILSDFHFWKTFPGMTDLPVDSH
jgi:hypothetical protein